MREGISRRDQRREDGTLRDSVVFSILDVEWPVVRDGLRARLDRGAANRARGGGSSRT